MSTYNFTTSGDYTNTSGDLTITNLNVTAKGQDGQGPTPGAGGASVSGDGVHGKGADPSGSPGGGYAYIGNGSGNDEYDSSGSPYDLGVEAFDRNFELNAPGGASSATAGGSSGDKVTGTIPAGLAVTLEVGMSGSSTKIYDENGPSNSVHADSGQDASGNTPGVSAGGSGDDSGQYGDVTATNGNSGTAGTGGNGADGGANATVTPASLTLQNGGVIRFDADNGSLIQDPDGTPVNLLTVTDRLGSNATTDLVDGIASHNGGLGGDAEGSESGASGGTAATALMDGTDGIPAITDPGDNGADGADYGDGGNGSGAFGSTGGAGKLGKASFDYVAAGPAFKVWYIRSEIQVSETSFQ